MRILVTGGMGFIGSHAAEHFARQGWDVTVLDNLSRAALLNKEILHLDFNRKYLQQHYPNIRFVDGSIADASVVDSAAKDANAILHAAAQTAVTTSVVNPRPDFESNAIGTFNVLEAARKHDIKNIAYCSTNKIFGDNVNSIKTEEGEKHYRFEDAYKFGVPENFPIDHCEHTPYGCSKLTGDLYMQDYAHLYGLRSGVFRMSCIYGERQFGVEDQGWVAWFTIATILGKPLTIYGDGKQVRDVLYVTDLVKLFDKFLTGTQPHGVYCTGGGPNNTLSLLELLDILEKETGKRSPITFQDWRPSDQKVFIADTRKAANDFSWKPDISPTQGVQKLASWVSANKHLFET